VQGLRQRQLPIAEDWQAAGKLSSTELRLEQQLLLWLA